MIDDRFVGAWRLLSYELRDAQGQVSYPMGQSPQGLLLYTPDGHMSATLHRSDRPKFTSPDLLRLDANEIATALSPGVFLGYAGTFEIQGETVLHHVEISGIPNWIGNTQVRYFAFNGDQLVLSTPPMLLGGVEQRGYLHWQRVNALAA